MPEFILDHGTPEAARQFDQLDEFTQGYIEALFFTNTGTGDDAENGLERATVAELASDALAGIVADCKAFQEANRADLDQAIDDSRINGYDAQRAGNDFWYTRNHHGVGYWDRDLGELGDTLTKAAHGWREKNLYRGDDGLIYLD